MDKTWNGDKRNQHIGYNIDKSWLPRDSNLLPLSKSDLLNLAFSGHTSYTALQEDG